MRRLLLALLLASAAASAARADFVEYAMPLNSKIKLVFLLEAERVDHHGRTVTLTHRLGKIHMLAQNVEKIHKVPSRSAEFAKIYNKVRNADSAMQAARWALKHGMIAQCYRSVDKALELDPTHVDARRVADLRKTLDVDLGDSRAEEEHIRRIVVKRDMKIKKSKHFILLYDTPDTPQVSPNRRAKKRKPRAVERLELLETVYEAFLLKFYAQGMQIDVPKERLKVVLFNDQKDYLHFATSLDPSLSSAIGFFDPTTNIAFFYDHSTSKRFESLRALSQSYERQRKDAVKNQQGEIVRIADTLSLLLAIEQENADIEVVSHECTHQVAANTGLLPRHVRIPSWVHEGLATYFEAPDDATWSGMGAVNKERLDWYKMLERHPEYSKIDFLIADQIIDLAGNHATVVAGYGQAWAFTHFMIERHFDKFMKYYRRLGEMPPYMTLNQEVLTSLFDEVFGSDRKALDFQWRSYMRELRTDKEVLFGDD